MRYDNLFLNDLCSGNHTLAKSRTEEIVLISQNFFNMANALGTTIALDILNVKHVDTTARLRSTSQGATCDVDCTM